MKESELEAIVQQKTTAAFETLGASLAEQVKEQMKAALADLKHVNTEAEKAAAKKSPFKGFGEFLGAVRDFRMFGKYDPRLEYVNADGKIISGEATKTLTEGTDSAGGFLVYEEYRKELQMLELEQAVIRPGATVLPMRSDAINIPAVDETSRASNFYGGVVGYWIDEAATKTSSEPKFRNVKLIAKKLAGYTKISNELLADSGIAMEPLLTKMFAGVWGYMEDDAYINGSGVGRPLGIMNSGALVTVTRSANLHVYFKDLAKMVARMLPGSFQRSVFLINQEVFPELITLTTSNTTLATGANAIWINPNQGAAQALPGTIFGRPFYITDKCAALGTTGDIILLDRSHYLIGDRQPITIDVSTHVGFVTDETYYRFVLRVDGQPWLNSALTPAHGTDTLSPFVVLSTGS